MLAVVAFSGVVPPHRASDGRVFVAFGPSAQAVEAGLRACHVAHYGPVGGRIEAGAASHAYQFAVGPKDAGSDACVAARLGEGGRVEARDRWVG